MGKTMKKGAIHLSIQHPEEFVDRAIAGVPRIRVHSWFQLSVGGLSFPKFGYDLN